MKVISGFFVALLLVLAESAVAQLDSINSVMITNPVAISESEYTVKALTDSVKAIRVMDSLRLTSLPITDSIQSRINEVLHLAYVDSIREKLDRVNQMPSIQKFRGVLAKSEGTVQKMTEEINSVEHQLNVDAGMSQLDKLRQLGIDANRIGLSENVLNQQDRLGSVSVETTELMKGVGVRDLGSNATEATQYVQAVNSTPINDESIGKLVEEKVAGLNEMAGVEEEIASVTDYTELIKKWNSDPDFVREQAVNKAKEEAVNHFAEHQHEVTGVMNKLNRAKLISRLREVEGATDLFKKAANPMKSKPFIERVVLGIAIQVQASSVQWFDFNPYFGYRATGRINFGMGWVERVATDFRQLEFVAKDHLFGFRGFVEFKTVREYFFRAEVEGISIKGKSYASKAPGEDWVASYFIGVKKSFNLTKAFKGNMQLLYSLYDPHKFSPYLSRLNARVGFEVPLQKRSD